MKFKENEKGGWGGGGLISPSFSPLHKPLPPIFIPAVSHQNDFYVTDGNIMYLTNASRSLISCVIQHYAPVVGWWWGGGGGGGAQSQNFFF
jgi:hypothetical protein